MDTEITFYLAPADLAALERKAGPRVKPDLHAKQIVIAALRREHYREQRKAARRELRARRDREFGQPHHGH